MCSCWEAWVGGGEGGGVCGAKEEKRGLGGRGGAGVGTVEGTCKLLL